MPNSLYIAPIDPMQASQDWQQTQARTSILQSTAGLDKVKLEGAQRSLAEDKAFQEQLAKVSPTLPLFDKLGEMANAAMTTGKFKEAEMTTQLMSVMLNRESLMQMRKDRIEAERGRTATAELTKMQQIYSGVSSPLEKAMADDIFKQTFGKESPLAKYPYDPGMVKMFGDSLTKRKSALEDQLTRARILREQAAAKKDALVADAQAKYLGAKTADVEKKTAATAKAAGKNATPTKQEIDSAGALVKVAHPDLSPAEWALASREIAADAKDIHNREGGSYADALEKAMAARKGQFVKFPPKTFMGFETGKGGTRYEPHAPGAPMKGAVVKGYKVLGGDPSKKENWEKVNGD